MTPVCKYNISKAVSIVLTMGTPVVTLFSCSSLYIHRSETALSAGGVLLVLILALIFKDKLLENFKAPSPLIFCLIGTIIVIMVQYIMSTILYIFVASTIACGIDALTFRSICKKYDILLPRKTEAYKHWGFIFARNPTIEGLKDE